jgi:hypothetical protein
MCFVFRYGMILADNGSSWFFQGEAASPEAWAALITLRGQDAADTDLKLEAFRVGESACH